MAELTLGDLDASIIDDMRLDGRNTRFLIFACPVVGHDHYHIMPFHDAECMALILSDGEEVMVWQRIEGTTIKDLTLSPSYFSSRCCLDLSIEEGQIFEGDSD